MMAAARNGRQVCDCRRDRARLPGRCHQDGKILAGGQFVIIQAIHELRVRAKRPHATLRAFDQFRTAEKRLIRQMHDLPFRCILFWA